MTDKSSYPPAEMGTQYPIQSDRVELWRVMEVIRRRKWLILCIMLLVLTSGGIYTYRQKPVYESKAMMILAANQPIASPSDDLGLLNDLLSLTKRRTILSQMEIITSQEVIESAARKLGDAAIQTGFHSEGLPEWSISIDNKKDSDVVMITTRAYSRLVAADLANFIVLAYMEQDQGFSNDAAKQGRQYIATEMESVQKQLTATQKELSDYKRKTGLVASNEQLRAIAANVLAVEMERDRANVELAAAKQQVQELQKQLQSEGGEILQSTTVQLSPQYQEALNSLGRLHAQRAALIQEYTPESLEVKKVDGEIAEAEQRMKVVTQDIVSAKVHTRNPTLSSYLDALVREAGADARANALAVVISERNRQVDALPEQERAIARLMQTAGILERTYQTLSDKYYTLMVNERSTLPTARLASSARPAESPVSPDRRKNAALFFLLGLMLSVGTVSVAERMDKRIRDEVSVTELTGAVPLSMIPEQRALRSFGIEDLGFDGPFMESLRMLNNVLSFSTSDNPLGMIAVTSPGRGEGRSTIAASLAAVMAMNGKKALLVDCDLRNPVAHKYMNLPGDIGLSNLLKGTVTIDKAVQSAKMQNLYCLPAGPLPPNPAELFNSPESRKVFDKLRESYDAVILDCPQCAGLSDMQVISSIADRVLLVVSINHSERSHLQSALFGLDQVNAPYVGIVINRLNTKRIVGWYPGDSNGKDTRRSALVRKVLALIKKGRQ